MTEHSSDSQQGGRPTSESKFNDLRKAIADRNEAAHKQARDLRAARERAEFGIVARHKVDLDR